jgi:hypothetical protein
MLRRGRSDASWRLPLGRVSGGATETVPILVDAARPGTYFAGNAAARIRVS